MLSTHMTSQFHEGEIIVRQRYVRNFRTDTYNMKSWFHEGVFPLTAMVDDLTFCSFRET